MKIQKIVDICKKSGQLYITEAEGAQWIGNGQAVYPLYDLPKLTAEELCTIYSITEEQRDKMILNEKDASEYKIDFSAINGDEEATEVVNIGLHFGGTSLIMLKCGGGISFVKRMYLTPFKEEVQYWRRTGPIGEYFVVTAGMFIKAIIVPETGLRADIAGELKEIVKMI